MTPEIRAELRQKLEDRAHEILRRTQSTVSEARDAPPTRTDVLDAPELSLVDNLKAVQADLSDRDRALLVEIRDALQRFDDDQYGICVDCGEAVELGRLRAVPWAARCASDQERFEEEQRRFPPPTL
jgi:DnaK suppressor protein